MGSCLSKKGESPATLVSGKAVKVVVAVPDKTLAKTEQIKREDEDVVKREIFVIKHRRSHSSDKQIEIQKLPPESQNRSDQLGFGTPVRTSGCTREEVDAILIQCGRLSRSSSANITPVGKKHSRSKQSFDFDNEDDEAQRRQSRSSRSSPSKPRRRRTPSRERTLVSGSGRRVSISPGRRSEIPAAGAGADHNGGARPGKMVSVPASVTSSISAGHCQSSVRRIAVRRDVRSPRSQSPAQSRPPPLTLSRSNSRKTDQSPHRRNPLSEIDNNHSSQMLRKSSQNQSLEEAGNRSLSSMRGAKVEIKTSQVSDNSLPLKFNRSRSWSRSRDLDELGHGVNTNPNPNASSYAALLLEDIQNFHQKSSHCDVAIALPQCVSKACSIMEAVADMNSTTSSSIAASDDKKQSDMKKFEVREVEASNELMEPCLHKYVTMRRGTGSSADMGDQESSGSNSVAGGCQQRWGSPSEPESVGGLTSKTSTRKKDLSSPLGLQRQKFL